MSEELPKYHLIGVYSSDENHSGYDFFMKKVNASVKQGYKVHTFISEFESGEYLGTGDRKLLALMSLSSSTKYDDIERLVDVAPHEVNAWLDKGYIVADSWAKNIRMVKKK